jgi:hypothetical protein
VLAIIRCRIFCLRASFEKVKIKVYSTLILPVVLYGCAAWSLTLREEHRPKVFENRVLRQIYILGLKRDEVRGEWRTLHSDRLDALYTLPSIVRMIK